MAFCRASSVRHGKALRSLAFAPLRTWAVTAVMLVVRSVMIVVLLDVVQKWSEAAVEDWKLCSLLNVGDFACANYSHK